MTPASTRPPQPCTIPGPFREGSRGRLASVIAAPCRRKTPPLCARSPSYANCRAIRLRRRSRAGAHRGRARSRSLPGGRSRCDSGETARGRHGTRRRVDRWRLGAPRAQPGAHCGVAEQESAPPNVLRRRRHRVVTYFVTVAQSVAVRCARAQGRVREASRPPRAPPRGRIPGNTADHEQTTRSHGEVDSRTFTNRSSVRTRRRDTP
jgi:hypothetical protein